MTEGHQMQQPANSLHSMFPPESGGQPPTENLVETQRSLDPHTSLEDYNRTMLEYTQRQMSSFVDLDEGSGSCGTSSRSSQSSGNSGVSSNGVLVRQASGPPPSANSAVSTRHGTRQHGHRPVRSPNEAKPSRY
ncbi:hypothetical protein N7462_003668 [Penicillium macrosclerotiorum]|uniref:uncharacterized protein n=1 Tax=Penicillium macrosclerotiorum TaxID=303699 RepID=UPI00254923B5|nr:uncharacterized protein N7462_003668 [Penicillium macrosclerotiorum]KAJ5689276.1 hypothetical protein N7462_003668 [Penicillium macrosclerotiorum]